MKSVFNILINFINTNELDDVYTNAARKLLEHLTLVPKYTISEIATLCFVSPATISRLCRKLNYESYIDFKMEVAMNLQYFNRDAIRQQFDYQLPATQNPEQQVTKEAFANHFDNIIANLQITYNTISFDTINQIVDLIYTSQEICFSGNFFTQSISMQLQIELSYLGKKCTGMYAIKSQLEIIQQLQADDLIIFSTISGGSLTSHPDLIRAISKSKAKKVCITQLDKFPYNDTFDVIIQVGTNHQSLIGKFSVIYIFELLEAIYHLKYSDRCY